MCTPNPSMIDMNCNDMGIRQYVIITQLVSFVVFIIFVAVILGLYDHIRTRICYKIIYYSGAQTPEEEEVVEEPEEEEEEEKKGEPEQKDEEEEKEESE
jgi:hypothetical protein